MVSGENIPQEKAIDKSVALLSEGYPFILNRRRKLQSDIIETRLMGQKVICMSGIEAARVFYDPKRFRRQGAAPKRVLKTLFGEKGVQTLDGGEHEHRKALFMSLMTKDRLLSLNEITKNEWEENVPALEAAKELVLFDEAQKVLYRIACKWAGVPILEKDVTNHAESLGALVDALGAVGPRHWKGRNARKEMNDWARNLIEQVREEKLQPNSETALYKMSFHKDITGSMLDGEVAAVELINILRPIVAIATYVMFGALALYHYPETKQKIKENENNYVHFFVQEVRRFYPFTPFTGALVAEDFSWNEFFFKKDTLVLLDVYGMNHCPKIWDEPDQFKPERFSDREKCLYDFIPQGGGDYDFGHRCAGEWVTIEVMKESLTFLATKVDYDVPLDQKLDVDLKRIPARPESGFVMNNVRSVF